MITQKEKIVQLRPGILGAFWWNVHLGPGIFGTFLKMYQKYPVPNEHSTKMHLKYPVSIGHYIFAIIKLLEEYLLNPL